MFRRNLLPIWAGILALSGIFLMGQDQTCYAPQCIDNDLDGYYAIDPACCPEGDDCDDGNANVYPGAPELCDGTDNHCPGDAGYGEVDEGYPMICIPGDCFQMGDSSDSCNYGLDECPVHEVCISAFEMDFHEVTNAEYGECVTDGACTAPLHSYSYTRPSYYGDPAYANFPVIWVDWYQASAYCEWAGKRLPTEAEWEYAARGGLAGKRYPRGDLIDCDDANYGRWDASSECWDFGGLANDTHPVKSYIANGYGLHDLAGNVWEWVSDFYDPEYYQHSVVQDPPGPDIGTARVQRGGSWDCIAADLRVANREDDLPTDADVNRGFRCARGGAYGP
ncbi:MAG: SUMF1/EgtB/PvdO family nonheme iron enzyme [bacterium]